MEVCLVQQSLLRYLKQNHLPLQAAHLRKFVWAGSYLWECDGGQASDGEAQEGAGVLAEVLDERTLVPLQVAHQVAAFDGRSAGVQGARV